MSAAPGAPRKPHSHAQKQHAKAPKRLRFRPYVFIRQRSAQDDQGNSIPGTETHTTGPYAPVRKKEFFAGNMVDVPLAHKDLSDAFVAQRLATTAADGETPKSAAEWLVTYLLAKKHALLTNPATKVGLGNSKLGYAHIYIMDAILAALQRFLRQLLRASRIRRAARASSAGKLGQHSKYTLKF